jgi:hypothetical protein
MRDGSFPFTVVSGVPVVTAPEEIDITNAPALQLALLEAGAHGHGTLAVDMTATRFCDSSGLHVSRRRPLLYLPGPGSNASPQGVAAKSRAPRNGPGPPGRDSAAAAG